jgi:L-ascorbate metabolism protein UlaG (beta-lactamase superfamily)
VIHQARQIAGLARFLGAREQRERDDADAQRELEATPLELPGGLEIEWLGVAGYRLTYEGHTLLVDPYFSRAPVSSVLRREPALPDTALLDRVLESYGEVVGVLVGHTHFDHAVDAPAIARRFACPALGSASLGRLMRLHGLGEQAVEVAPHHPYELGPFTVSFVPSRHSKLLLGLAVPFAGELTCAHLDALSPSAYKCGQVWGIRIEVGGATLYHQGSADLIDEEIRKGEVDFFLAGIAGRSFTRDYWSRVLARLDPGVVIASHYDDFFRPYEAPMGFSLNVNLTSFPEEIAAVSRDIAVATLPPPHPPGASSQ